MDVEQVQRQYGRIWTEKSKVNRYLMLCHLRELEAEENLAERWEKDEQGNYQLVELVSQAGKSWIGDGK